MLIHFKQHLLKLNDQDPCGAPSLSFPVFFLKGRSSLTAFHRFNNEREQLLIRETANKQQGQESRISIFRLPDSSVQKEKDIACNARGPVWF